MAHEATRAACFQPNEYQNIELFADRYLIRDELAGDLRSFLDPDGSGQAFEGFRDGYRTVQELNSLGVDEGLLKLSVQCSALIPRYLLSNDDYMLSPLLHFLV